MRLRRGFTLVELLVVIGIIALLIGILLPVLGKARMAGYNAKCLSNLRQLHQFGQMYATENSGWALPRQYGWNGGNPTAWNTGPITPPGNYDPKTWENANWWWDTTPMFRSIAGLPEPPGLPAADYSPKGTPLAQYLNAPMGMACPLAVLAIRNRDSLNNVPLRYSYGYNTDTYDPQTKQNIAAWYSPGIVTWKVSSVRRSADKIEWGDSCDTWVKAGASKYYPTYGEQTWQSTPPQGNLIAYRHGKWKVNLCFWDGHAEPMNKDDIIVGDRDGLNTADYDGTVDTSVQGSNEHFHKYWLMWAE